MSLLLLYSGAGITKPGTKSRPEDEISGIYFPNTEILKRDDDEILEIIKKICETY